MNVVKEKYPPTKRNLLHTSKSNKAKSLATWGSYVVFCAGFWVPNFPATMASAGAIPGRWSKSAGAIPSKDPIDSGDKDKLWDNLMIFFGPKLGDFLAGPQNRKWGKLKIIMKNHVYTSFIPFYGQASFIGDFPFLPEVWLIATEKKCLQNHPFSRFFKDTFLSWQNS